MKVDIGEKVSEIRAALRNERPETAVHYALDLLETFLLNHERIAAALDVIADEIKRRPR